MLTSPLASLSGWTWNHALATDLPAALRLAFPPSGPGTPGDGAAPESEHPAVSGSGPGTSLRFPATGRWHHVQKTGSDVHWIWGGAADVLDHGEMRTRLPFGNPVLALRIVDTTDATGDKGDKKGTALGQPVELGATPVAVAQLTVLAAAPGAPGLDTLGVLRHLASALDDEGLTSGAPTWQDFVATLAGLEQPLRILEPGGAPATGRSVRLGGAAPVTLDAAHRGDALAALGIGRADLAGGPILDVAGGDDVVVSAAGSPVPDGLVTLSPTSSTVTVASLHDWFAPQQAGALERFTRGNLLRPFADGVDTFADLFTELADAVAARDGGAFYLTGYSLHHDAKLVPAGPTTPWRSVQEVAEAMAGADGEPRFLALQMLQLEPAWVRDVATTAAIAALLLAVAGAGATAFQTDSASDQASFFLHAEAIAVALFVGAANLDDLLDNLELNRSAIEALHALPGVEAHLDPVDAEVDDNPRAQTSDLIDLALNAQRRFNVFHQKIQVVRNTSGIHAYCGGIDLNANRTQTPAHGSRSPFHDVHARVDGPAASELSRTFIERWRAIGSTPLAIEEDAALDDPPTAGADVLQVARTYYRPDPASTRGLEFAPNGESTILETLVAAIGRARRYIYIEDQYLTPPPDFRDALEDAAAAVSGPLIIAVPASPDQPFGLPRRQEFIEDMRAAWGDRVKVGILRKRFSHFSTSLESAAGRLWLGADLAAGDDTVDLTPVDRVPSTPFWLTVGGEAMRAHEKVSGFSSPTVSRLRVERADASRLFGESAGTAARSHKEGAAVSAGTFPSIYVHSKMMLVDDAFASIGSANLNRRGFYSDGECNLFAVRESIADGADNWIRDLRLDLWAEHLGLTQEYARAALRDPAVGLKLFDRKFTVGSRFTTFDAQPYATDLTLRTSFEDTTSGLGGVAVVGTFAGGIAAAIAGEQSDAIFDTVIDPSSRLEGP